MYSCSVSIDARYRCTFPFPGGVPYDECSDVLGSLRGKALGGAPGCEKGRFIDVPYYHHCSERRKQKQKNAVSVSTFNRYILYIAVLSGGVGG